MKFVGGGKNPQQPRVVMTTFAQYCIFRSVMLVQINPQVFQVTVLSRYKLESWCQMEKPTL